MITIKLRDPSGTWHTFVGEDKISITEQCEKHDIDSPFACRAGACTTCACKIVKWKEFLVQEKVGMKLIDTDEDQFLTCIWGLHEGHIDTPENNEVILDFLD